MELRCRLPPSFSAVVQPKSILVYDKQGPKLALPDPPPLFVSWATPLGTTSSFTILRSKHVFGGSARKKRSSHLTAAEEWTDEILMDEGEEQEDEEDEYEEFYDLEEKPESQVGDGEDGGGVSLGDTVWGSKALATAEEVISSCKDLEIFAFKVSNRGQVFVRLDKLSNKYGSPSIDEIETFSSIYSERLEEAKQAGVVPDAIAVEVSSPGAERIVRVPRDLERFKDLPMYVRYIEETSEGKQGSQEQEGIFQLDNVEMESGYCTWRLANVKLNRQSLGKGRAFNKKQREWRLRIPFSSLVLVRLYLEI